MTEKTSYLREANLGCPCAFVYSTSNEGHPRHSRTCQFIFIFHLKPELVNLSSFCAIKPTPEHQPLDHVNPIIPAWPERSSRNLSSLELRAGSTSLLAPIRPLHLQPSANPPISPLHTSLERNLENRHDGSRPRNRRLQTHPARSRGAAAVHRERDAEEQDPAVYVHLPPLFSPPETRSSIQIQPPRRWRSSEPRQLPARRCSSSWEGMWIVPRERTKLTSACSRAQPHRYLLDEVHHRVDQEREAGQDRGELCEELRGSVFGREFLGYQAVGEYEEYAVEEGFRGSTGLAGRRSMWGFMGMERDGIV